MNFGAFWQILTDPSGEVLAFEQNTFLKVLWQMWSQPFSLTFSESKTVQWCFTAFQIQKQLTNLSRYLCISQIPNPVSPNYLSSWQCVLLWRTIKLQHIKSFITENWEIKPIQVVTQKIFTQIFLKNQPNGWKGSAIYVSFFESATVATPTSAQYCFNWFHTMSCLLSAIQFCNLILLIVQQNISSTNIYCQKYR